MSHAVPGQSIVCHSNVLWKNLEKIILLRLIFEMLVKDVFYVPAELCMYLVCLT